METTGSIRIDQVDFHLRQRGEQVSAVFLHGFGDDLSSWDLLWQHLDPSLACLRYDLRGFGDSVCETDQAFSHTEDLRCLLDAMNLQKVDLVGVSMGGSIALNFALNYPRRVNRLVLISPGLVAWEWSERWRGMWQPIVELAKAGALPAARELWWQHPLFAAVRESEHAEYAHAAVQRFAGRQWIEDHESPALPDVERLFGLQADTLLLSGGRDDDEFRLIADLIESSAATVKRIDRAEWGHLPHIESPAECARLVNAFLTVD